MRKILILLGCLLASLGAQAQDVRLTTSDQARDEASRYEAAFAASGNELENLWARGKKALYGLNLDIGTNISLLAQRVTPGGKQTSFQTVYNPYFSWQVLPHSAYGSGEINVGYTLARYWGPQAVTLQQRAGLAVHVNNYEDNQENFAQLSYTHTLPGAWNWLSATVGQYPIDSFEGGQYLNDQQTGLIHYALSQNASAIYPDSSFGAYLQAKNEQFAVAAGYQDGQNLSGAQIRLNDAFDGKYTAFGSVMWTPHLALGAAQYGILYYHQPSVSKRPGSGHGWSFNGQQNIGEEWAVFARINGSTGGLVEVKNSYVIGGARLDPLHRHSQDAIVVGLAYNRLTGDEDVARSSETVLEAQWVWGVGKLVTVTPDLQLIPQAGMRSSTRPVAVFGVRTTVML